MRPAVLAKAGSRFDQSEIMAKRKPEIRIRTFGIYTKWQTDSKRLPQIVEVTTRVPAVIDIEFGFVVNVKGAKNQKLAYCINHPGILDADCNKRAPFAGVVYVKTSDWDFYLGDTIWLPLDDKMGPWRMSVQLDEDNVAEKTFDVYRVA